MSAEIREKCAVFLTYKVDAKKLGTTVAKIAFIGLGSMQHRGQDGSGMGISDGSGKFAVSKGLGKVADVYSPEFLETDGEESIGQNRYRTSGGHGKKDLQPMGDRVLMSHNGNFPITQALDDYLDDRGVPTDNLNDSGKVHQVLEWNVRRGASLMDAFYILHTKRLLEGAGSIVAMTKDEIAATRDRNGIRPLSMGSLGGGTVFASETCALDDVGAQFVRDINPGEVYTDGKYGKSSYQAAGAGRAMDAFEIVYFSDPRSILYGRKVSDMRRDSGIQLAREFNVSADYVLFVPNSGYWGGRGFSEASGIPMLDVFSKKDQRVFIEADQTARLQAADERIKIRPDILESGILRGSRVIIVEDSVVRGTNSPVTARKVREAGAEEIYFGVVSPPYTDPDFFGVDTPTKSELLANRMSHREREEYLGVEGLYHLSKKGLFDSYDISEEELSAPYFGGRYVYPVPMISRELVAA